ncbi:hypothetical protein CBR_g45729 [Chara braunii]|uniref:DNA methylase N-4/N-6 domain-containing protein n=1 Tax=Chara braunii TaxID=69332 RepID=A0A388LZ30_CHABU|nr:hypothetical protein CBR_g45729 [Chara braunii]|eukprot:GBG87577.1 hypothetical protein CBR_g45729 [Chara braunii]
MCKIMRMWQKSEVKGQKLKPAVESFLKVDPDLESSEPEGEKKNQRWKRLDRATAKEQEMTLLYPRVQLQGNRVPMVAEDMSAQHWITIGSMPPENAVPILLEVIANQISLKEMENKFQLVKQLAYVCKAFAVGVGAGDFKEVEKEFPLHTKKKILEKFVGGIKRGQTSIPALDGHIKQALEWKNKERRPQAKEALYTFHSKPLVEPFVNRTEVTHENDSAGVKIINGDMQFLSKLQKEKLPISLTIFDFRYGFVHEGHASDHKPFPESDIVARFCSVDMLPSIRSAFREVCNAEQEFLTWCKPNVTNPGGPQLCPLPVPEAIYFVLWLVNNFSPAGACALDGFSGSGTGAIACVKANRNCFVVEINTKCAKGITTRLLTDVSDTLGRETLKRKQKVTQGSPTSELSGDAISVENELVANEDTGTAAGVAESVGRGAPVGYHGAALGDTELPTSLVGGPSGATLSTVEAVAGPTGVPETASWPSVELAPGPAGVQPTASGVPLPSEVRPVVGGPDILALHKCVGFAASGLMFQPEG